MSTRLFVLLFTIINLPSFSQANDDYEQVRLWLTDLSGEYSMGGSSGCENFLIVSFSGSLSTFFFADFGAARTPEESLLLSIGSRGSLKVTENSDNILSYKYIKPKGMFGGKQSIKVKIVTSGNRKLESLKIITKRGFSRAVDRIYCKTDLRQLNSQK